MNLSDIRSIDPSSCVLFLGSGFSADATNSRNESPPNGPRLRRGILDRLNITDDPGYDLRVLSDELIDLDATTFSNWLGDIFRINLVPDDHLSILSHSWRRLYTTNYDDLVEYDRFGRGKKPDTFDVGDPLPTKFPKGAVVHLHGSVRNITPEGLRNSLVLGERSYVNQHFHESPWYGQFQRDLSFAEHIFFIGYSLSDYLISALLTANPNVAERTIFIRRGLPDAIEINRLKAYGSIEPIGIDGFAGWLNACPKASHLLDTKRLKAFRSLDPDKDSKSVQAATAPEIFDLLIYGSINVNRIFSTLPNETYITRRQTLLDNAVIFLNETRVLLVDARIGNGKTVFLYVLAASLRSSGAKCFIYRSGHPDLQKEIDTLAGIKDVYIFFDNYNEAIEVAKKFLQDLPNAHLIIEIRSSIYQLRYHELQKRFPFQPRRLSINDFDHSDRDTLLNLASKAGLPASIGPKHKDAELRDLLLNIFENQSVRKRIEQIIAPLLRNSALRDLLVATSLIGTNRIAVSADLMKIVTPSDPYSELTYLGEVTTDIFNFDVDGIELRSSLFGEFLLNQFIDPADICKMAIKLITFCAERKDSINYRGLMGELMTYGNLFDKLGQNERATRSIIDVYEKLRGVQSINDDPLFWLQYAIASVDAGRLDLAENYIDRSYERAAARGNFETYQIDTQAFRIALLVGKAGSKGSPVQNFDEILRLAHLVDGMLREDSHRPFAVKVLDNIDPFINERANDLSKDERSAFAAQLGSLATAMRSLPADFVSPFVADKIASGLEKDVSKLFPS